MEPLPARILVVDDDPQVRDMVRRCLELEGYEVTLAEDGRAALEAVARQRPDLVILDRLLPHLDGIGVVMLLRQRAEGVTLPILMLTGRGYAADKVFGLEAGADDYVAKPFEVPELLARVAALLRRARDERARIEIWEGIVAGLEAERDAALQRVAELEALLQMPPVSARAADAPPPQAAPPTTGTGSDPDPLDPASARPWWRPRRPGT